MEYDKIFIAMDKQTFMDAINEVLDQRFEEMRHSITEDEKISKSKACQLIGISQPTLDMSIKQGKFKVHEIGKRKYMLRSEIMKTLYKQ